MAKLHWSDQPPGESGLYNALCGQLPPVVAEAAAQVTCALCRRQLEARPAAEPFTPRALTEYTGQSRWKVTDPCIDRQSDFPVVTRETWPRVKADCRCGSCVVCRGYRDIGVTPSDDPWTERAERRHRSAQLGFPDVTQALIWYADELEDGVCQKTVGEALERLFETGTTVQGGGHAYRDGPQLARAIRLARIEKALGLAYRGPDAYGLGRRVYLRWLFSRLVGPRQRTRFGIRREPVPAAVLGEPFGLSPAQVGKVIKRGKREVWEAMTNGEQRRLGQHEPSGETLRRQSMDSR